MGSVNIEFRIDFIGRLWYNIKNGAVGAMMLNTYNPKFNKSYEEIIRKFEQCGFIPIVTVEDISDALPLVGALTAANIDVVEITYRSNVAEDVIRIISSKCPNVTIGAGTVLTVEQIAKAQKAGAKFIVTPGFNPKVVDRAIEVGIPVFPGCCSPSDLDMLYERGLRVGNFFPCEQLGGIAMLQALSAPYPFIRFIPTGGINLNNLCSYLAYNKVLCCGGSFVATPEDLKEDKFDNITRKAKDVVNAIMDLELDSFTLYAKENDVSSSIRTVSKISGLPVSEGTASGVGIEVDPSGKRPGTGCVTFRTGDVERALYYLKRRGCTVDEKSVVSDGNHIKEAYLLDKMADVECKLIRKE